MPAEASAPGSRYDRIGVGYANVRRPDPRIAAMIDAALGDARTVINVGAGTGSYEPVGRVVTAVEPSATMIAQRPAGAAPVVQAAAEALPFADDAFDAAMAVLTIHHWQNPERGLRELRRVTRGPIVIVTFDPAARPWLTDYLPELAALDAAQMPTMVDYKRWLGGPVVTKLVPIPYDCSDGFLYAYWRRPAAYLDPALRAGISSFARIDPTPGLGRLAADLKSGVWASRYAGLLRAETYDAGYRLIICENQRG